MLFGRFSTETWTWSGSGGELQRKELDVSLWVQGAYREVGISQSEILQFSVCKMLTSVGKVADSNFLGFVATFDVEIWYYLLALNAVTIFVCALSDVLLLHWSVKWKHMKAELAYYFWMFLSALFYEGSFRTPYSRRSQCLLGLWLLAMLILVNAFCGQFKALLMKKLEEPILDNNEDLAGRTDLQFHGGEGTECLENYQRSEGDSFVAVRERHMPGKGLEDIVVEPKEFQRLPLYQKVKEGKAAIFLEEYGLRGFLQLECDNLVGNRRLHLAKEDPFLCLLNFGFNSDLPQEWMDKINTRMLWLKEGFIVQKLLDDYVWNYDRCEEAGEDDEFKGIELKNLLPVFYLLLIVDAAAGIALFFEIVFKP